MTKYFKNILSSIMMALVFTASQMSQAMEEKGEGVKSEQGQMTHEGELIPTKMGDSELWWIMKQAVEEGTLKDIEIPQDIINVFGTCLHELSLAENPVLSGKLVYTGETETKSFKIRELVKDGILDLSDVFFGDTAKYVVIAIDDPEKFFRYDPNDFRLYVLMASYASTVNKIETTASHFEPLIRNWDHAHAPVALFYRMGYWAVSSKNYDYLININLIDLSAKNLYENGWRAVRARMCGRGGGALRKISCSF